MGFADFIQKRFMGKEICVFLNEDAETITLDQFWMNNKAYFRGIVDEVEDNVLVLRIEKVGIIYINCDEIVSVWEPPFNYNDAVRTSLSRKLFGATR